jgi:ABC-type proline/glycine betaine transport system permease subunit
MGRWLKLIPALAALALAIALIAAGSAPPLWS